jgi:hypothetical protein
LKSRWAVLALSLVLLAGLLAVYFPVGHYPFNAINDSEYVSANPHIRLLNGATVLWSLTSFYAANWHPLTWLSHALDLQLFASNAGGHHAVNLLLHALNSLLLFWVLWRATGRAGRSFMVAALFALHPINVESVAWVSERKNLLSMFFLLLALGAYRWYTQKPRIGRYSLVALLFVLGLMAKPQVITLPFLLLLWDYWPLERAALRTSLFAFRWNPAIESSGEERTANNDWRWLILEKLPLFALSVASATVTVASQQAGGAMGGVVRAYPLTVRLENAAVAYVRYLLHAVWPANLAFYYPHVSAFDRVWLDALLILVVITAFCIARSDRRYLAVGWLWFLGTLVPMIGLVQVGGQAMADRYGYLSFVGLFIMLCWGVADVAERWRLPQMALAGASVVVLATLGFLTHSQVGYWSSDVALWSHTVQVTDNNSSAENVLGETLQKADRSEEAMTHFRAAAAKDPLLPFPHYHLAINDEQHGELRSALEQFRQVLDLTQSDIGMMGELRSNTLLRMSSIYEALGQTAEADRCVSRAIDEHHRAQSFTQQLPLPER